MKVHSFYIEEAEKHGVEKAVILYNLRFWLEKNRANGSNERDGYYWTYNSAKAFSDLFPYFKERKINRLLNQLEEDGQILSGCFNKKGYDRTKWYSMPEFAVNNSDIPSIPLDTTPLVNSDKWIGQNCQMDKSGMTNGLVKTDRPIPDINTDKKPDSKPNVSTPHSAPDDFKPTDKQLEKMKLYGIDADLLVESFLSRNNAEGKKYKCWNSALTTWINNEIKWGKLQPTAQPKPSYKEFKSEAKTMTAEEKRAAFERAMGVK